MRFGQSNGIVLADNPYQVPSLKLRERPRFFNLHLVSTLGLVVFVMHMANGLAPHNLCVLRVPYGTLDLDSSRLVHPVALDDPYQNSACHVPLAPVTTLQLVSVFSLLSTAIRTNPTLIHVASGYPMDLPKERHERLKSVIATSTTSNLRPLCLDRFDPCNQPSVFLILGRNVHPIGLRLQTQSKQSLGCLDSGKLQLLVAHLS
jgi:hypothetical protein